MNAIVVMAVGTKHLRYFEGAQTQFELYAKQCQADLIVCTDPPDPTFKRSILQQKMLLPHKYINYDWMAYLDVDVLISNDAPSIFDYVNYSKAFAASVDPRETNKFHNVVNHYWRLPEILEETHQTYFTDRGYPSHPRLTGSINGGVFLCNPKKIASAFRDAYFTDFRETAQGGSMKIREPVNNDEAMMAYISQTNDLFFQLDEKFNTQIVYQIYADLNNDIISTINTQYFKQLQTLHNCNQLPSSAYDYPKRYREFVRDELMRCYVLHFSGGFPFIKIFNANSFSAHFLGTVKQQIYPFNLQVLRLARLCSRQVRAAKSLLNKGSSKN